MKTKIKTLAVIMTATLIFAMTACGKKPEETTAPTTATPETTVTETEETTKATTETTTEETTTETTEGTRIVATKTTIAPAADATTIEDIQAKLLTVTNESSVGSETTPKIYDNYIRNIRSFIGETYGYFIVEFDPNSDEAKLGVGDTFMLTSYSPLEASGTRTDPETITAAYNNYVLVIFDYASGDMTAPFDNPNAQAVYDAFVAYKG